MEVNGKTQPDHVFDKYFYMISNINDGAFEEGSDTKVEMKIHREGDDYKIRSLSVSVEK